MSTRCDTDLSNNIKNNNNSRDKNTNNKYNTRVATLKKKRKMKAQLG